MLDRKKLGFDPLLTSAFFAVQTDKSEYAGDLNCPLPTSAETLKNFLASSDGDTLRQHFKTTMEEMIAWVEISGLDPSPLTEFLYNYTEYSGYDDAENTRRLPFYQQGIHSLSSVMKLLNIDRIPQDLKVDIVKNFMSYCRIMFLPEYIHIFKTCSLNYSHF